MAYDNITKSVEITQNYDRILPHFFAPRQNYNKGQYEELRQFLQLDWDFLFLSHRNNVEYIKG